MRRCTLALCLFPLVLTGCPRDKQDPLTLGEAQESIEQAAASSQADALAAASVDLATNFTIGHAVEQAAAELQSFVTSQLPCAEVTLSGATLSIHYGVHSGSCVYRGHTFSGTSSVTVTRDDMNDVVVDHQWTDLSNGLVSLNGSAHVTWDFNALSRHVVHDLTWTQLSTGRSGHGQGDRTQSALPGGISQGIEVQGSRSWSGASGSWDLAIDGVELRWVDAVPQAGSYTLGTPYGKSVSMSFARVDADTIQVTVAGPKRSFAFTVSQLGSVTQQ